MAAVTFGSVCSGIEAASVAFGQLGWSAEWLAEIEPFPSAVLAHHYPDVPNLGDMTTIARRVLTGDVGAPEALCGGTPCQAFSVAGLRHSLSDARGNLTLKFVELADAIDHVRVRAGKPAAIVFWENVPGVLSTKDNAFGCFLAGLAGEHEPLEPPGKKWANAGAVYGPARAIAWRTLDAQYFGVAQRRRRVFVVASARNGFDPCQVLFEWDGVRRDTAPRRAAGQTAPTIPARSAAGGGLGTDFDCDGGLIPAVSQCITTGTGQRYDPETETILPVAFDSRQDPVSSEHLFGALGSSSPQAQAVAFAIQAGALRTNPASGPDGVGVQADHAYTLEAWAEVQAVCFDTTQITSQANRSNPQPGDPCHPLSAGAHQPVIAFSSKDHGADATTDLAPTLRAMNHADSHANGGGQMAVAIFRGENDGRMDGGTPQSQNDLPAGSVRGLRRCECGSAPQEQGLEGPQTGEPAAPVPELPHEGASVWNAVHAVREAAQGLGVLRDALPAAEAARRPGIQTDATCLQCGGLRGAEPFNVVLREARAAIQAGDTGQAADDEERGRAHPMAVRRLTPVECERLQGFPDNYTRIPSWAGWRAMDKSETPEQCIAEGLEVRQNKKTGKWRVKDVDGPRYTALGNSWAVPVAAWIGRRIDAELTRCNRSAA